MQVLTSAEYSALKARGLLHRTGQGGWSTVGAGELDGGADGRPVKRARPQEDADADMGLVGDADAEGQRARQQHRRCAIM